MKKNINFGEIPKTLRERESGEMLINYLFGCPVIKNIFINEAKKINNIEYWKNIDKLRSIFKKRILTVQKNIKLHPNIKQRNVDHISLYYTGGGINDDLTHKKVKKIKYTDNDMEIDIN